MGLLLASQLAFFAHGGAAEQFSLSIPYQSDAAQIDGDLSDPVWQHAAITELKYETRPAENAEAPVSTQARVYASKTTLFVAFIANDPEPDAIRGHLRPRDALMGEDMVGIKLDTFNNARLAYQFFVNPVGIQLDSIENELTKEESEAWDGIWHSAGKVTAKGYQVEIAIPLSQLSFNHSAGAKSWGFELIRYYPRDSVHRLSTHQISRANSCQLCQLGVATGFEQVDLGYGLQLTPSLVTKVNRERDQAPASDWQQKEDIEVGADLRWAISPSALLNATINPDFSQVEADAGQLNVNSAFNLFVEEKRPFFLDNKDYFDTQVPLVNTRNIISPDYGLKYTQKSDTQTLAILGANDRETQFLVPGNLSSSVANLKGDSQDLASRYLYTQSETLAVGGLFTAKTSDNYHNLVLSADVKYQPTEQDTLIAQLASSDTEYPQDLYQEFCKRGRDCLPPAPCSLGNCDVTEQVLRTDKSGAYRGELLKLGYKHITRDYFLRADYLSVGSDFRADLGFIEKVDIAKAVAGGGYLWYPEQHWFNEVEVGGDWDLSQNQAGEQIEQELEGYVTATGRWQSFVGAGWVVRERVGRRLDASSLAITGNTTEFNENRYWVETSLSPLSWVAAELSMSLGDEIDLANNRIANGVDAEAELEFKLTDGLSASVEHSYYALDIAAGEILTANLTDLRLHWQLSVESFIRLTSIYTHIARNPSLYLYQTPDRLTENLSSELLYGYRLNPLSVFYLGYGDNMLADDSYTALTRTEQTLFMKLSYAFIL